MLLRMLQYAIGNAIGNASHMGAIMSSCMIVKTGLQVGHSNVFSSYGASAKSSHHLP